MTACELDETTRALVEDPRYVPDTAPDGNLVLARDGRILATASGLARISAREGLGDPVEVFPEGWRGDEPSDEPILIVPVAPRPDETVHDLVRRIWREDFDGDGSDQVSIDHVLVGARWHTCPGTSVVPLRTPPAAYATPKVATRPPHRRRPRHRRRLPRPPVHAALRRARRRRARRGVGS